jgi:hypothetical protein
MRAQSVLPRRIPPLVSTVPPRNPTRRTQSPANDFFVASKPFRFLDLSSPETSKPASDAEIRLSHELSQPAIIDIREKRNEDQVSWACAFAVVPVTPFLSNI